VDLPPPERDATPADSPSRAATWLTVESPVHGALRVESNLAAGSETTVRFGAPATLQVAMRGQRPVRPRMTVCVSPLSERERAPYGSGVVDTPLYSDVVSFGPLQPQQVRVEVFAKDFWCGDRALASSTISLATGENAATIDVPAFQELRVAVPDSVQADDLN